MKEDTISESAVWSIWLQQLNRTLEKFIYLRKGFSIKDWCLSVKSRKKAKGESVLPFQGRRRAKEKQSLVTLERIFRKAIKKRTKTTNGVIKEKGEVELTSKFYSSKKPGIVWKWNWIFSNIFLCYCFSFFNASKREIGRGRVINNGANSRKDGKKNSSRVSHIEVEKQFFIIRNEEKDGWWI